MSIRFPIRTLLAAGASLLMATSLQAQTNYSYQKASGMLSVGAWVEGGISFPTNVDSLYSPELGFAFRPSVVATYPFTSSVFGMLSVGLDMRPGMQRLESDNNYRQGVRLNYLSIFPAVRFSAFVVGVNIGMPMSGKAVMQNGSGATEVESDIEEGGINKLETMIEPRIGAILTLMDDQTGWLGLSIMAGYPVTNQITSVEQTISGGGVTVTVGGDEKETHIPAVHLGLTYQFGIPGIGR